MLNHSSGLRAGQAVECVLAGRAGDAVPVCVHYVATCDRQRTQQGCVAVASGARRGLFGGRYVADKDALADPMFEGLL